MAVVVNNPSGGQSESGSGFLFGIIAIVVLILLFFYFGLPLLRGAQNVAPQGESQKMEITVPDKVDVNINQDPGQ